MSLLGTLGAITRNAKAIQEIAIAASKDLASVNNNTAAKKSGLPVFKVRTEPTTAKVATVIPEGMYSTILTDDGLRLMQNILNN